MSYNTVQRNNSIVAICNLALSRIGIYQIDTLDEVSRPARQCNALYEPMRDAVLEEHDWSFARKQRTLAQIDGDYAGWSYAYAYPDDCLAPRLIVSETNVGASSAADRMQYEVRINDATESNLILTDAADAVLIYTAAVQNPNLFSPLYIDALAYRLAAELAQPLKADDRLDQLMTQKYALKIEHAKAVNANIDNRIISADNAFVEARE